MKRPLFALLLAGLCGGALAQGAGGALPPPLAPPPKAVLPKSPSLPAITRPAASDAARTANVIRLANGMNETVNVSSTMPNRIATPFSSPKIVHNGDESLSFQVVGQDIYLLSSSDKPVGAFIYDGNHPNGQVASLTLIPSKLLGQYIVLTFDQPAPSVARGELESPKLASDYQDNLRLILRALAMGAVPTGFAEGPITAGTVLLGSLTVIPDKQYVGREFYIYRYRIENTGKDVVELSEPAFHDRGVRAVAFWPNIRLAPRESTYALIVADSPELEAAN